MKASVVALTLLTTFLSWHTCAAQQFQARSKINGMLVNIDAKKKVKYRKVGALYYRKGHLERIGQDFIQIEGQQIPLTELIEVKAAEKKNRVMGYLLTGGGALATAVGVTALASDTGEDGYGALIKFAGVFYTAAGGTSTVLGLRILRKKSFLLSHWEFIPTE